MLNSLEQQCVQADSPTEGHAQRQYKKNQNHLQFEKNLQLSESYYLCGIKTKNTSINKPQIKKVSTPENIFPVFDQLLQRSEKEDLLQQNAKVIWMTGLSGSGKTTIAKVVERKLHDLGYLTQLLDGDNIRAGISNNLTFSADDRKENIRRIAEVSKLFFDCGIVCINSFVSPTNEIRQQIIDIVGEENVLMVYVNTPLEECEKRDVKGLYAKARAGEIPNFTGISSPFEVPSMPYLEVPTVNLSVEESAELILDTLIPIIEPLLLLEDEEE